MSKNNDKVSNECENHANEQDAVVEETLEHHQDEDLENNVTEHVETDVNECQAAAEDNKTNQQDEEDNEPVESVNVEQLQKKLAEANAKADEVNSRLLRLQADFENHRRRTQKEKEEFYKYASTSLCEALLPVLDNFQLALNARDQDPVKVVEGVEMIHRQLIEVLQREGLTPINAVGEEFDPAKHEAVMQDSTGGYPDNTVTEELRRGYYLKDKLLRPAMVKVAKSDS